MSLAPQSRSPARKLTKGRGLACTGNQDTKEGDKEECVAEFEVAGIAALETVVHWQRCFELLKAAIELRPLLLS